MTSQSSTHLHHSRGEDLEIDFAVDLETRQLSWVFTRGLVWYGYPELAVRLPSDPPGDVGAIAVFLGAGLMTIGHQVLDLDGFVDVNEIPQYTDLLGDDPITLWVTGPDELLTPLPTPLLGHDVLLVGCSLWDQPTR